MYQNIKLYFGKELGSFGQQAQHIQQRFGHWKFSFLQLSTARIGNIIPAKCVAELFGNQPTKHKRHLEIIGQLVVFT